MLLNSKTLLFIEKCKFEVLSAATYMYVNVNVVVCVHVCTHLYDIHVVHMLREGFLAEYYLKSLLGPKW